MKEVEFVGECSGDGECFCWKVTEETYKNVLGQEVYEQELEFREIERKGIKEHMEEGTLNEKTGNMVLESLNEWYLYPNEVIGSEGTRFKLISYDE